MMKLIYARAKNYKGIYQGMGRYEIEITFGNGRITVIRGRNGSGKSTLNDLLGPYPDNNSCFIDKVQGEKELHYLVNKSYIVKIDIEHPVNKNGERQSVRGYIKKQGPNGFSELNPTGNITSYREILESEFKLDPNFVSLSKLSTEDKGIVEKTPADRKKFINGHISSVEVYNNMNRTLTKRSSVYKSMIVNLNAKISATGESENLSQSLKANLMRIKSLKESTQFNTNTLAEARAKISLLDPDGSIQNIYTSAKIELEKLAADEAGIQNQIDYIYSSDIAGLDDNKRHSREQCAKLYQDKKNQIIDLSAKSEGAKASLRDMFIQREEEYQRIQRLNQQIESLKSEYDFNALERTIDICENNIVKYEKFFSEINLKKGTTLSKDEYIIGLNTLKGIEDMIDSFKSFTSTGVISNSIDAILKGKNLLLELGRVESDIKVLKLSIDDLSSQYSYYLGLADRMNILSNRPSTCIVDDCPFIVDALAASKKDPIIMIASTKKALELEKISLTELEYTSEFIKDSISCIRDIQGVLKSIQSNASIIKKLPIQSSILNPSELLVRIRNGERFEEINELYAFIDYANIFEDYKCAKDMLYKAKTDYSIYESKNKVLTQLMEDVSSIIEKTKDISFHIEQTNSQISTWDNIILDSEEYFRTINALMIILGKLDEIRSKKMDYTARLNAASSNMASIENHISIAKNSIMNIDRNNAEMEPLNNDVDKIKYSLKMLEEYNAELKEFTASYNELDIYRKFTSVTKEGIQNAYIKVYMNQTRDLTNQLLAELFDGRMRLEEYVINSESFAIPCLSMYTGMITDDISRCSRSERAMISMIIGFVLLRQSSTEYNILRLDEVDEGLDTKNRLMFMGTLNYLMDLLQVEQCILISHTVELDMSSVDVIQLVDNENSMSIKEGNIIFEA